MALFHRHRESSDVYNEDDVKNIRHDIVGIICALPSFDGIPEFVTELIISIEAGYTDNIPMIPAFIKILRICGKLTKLPTFAKGSQLEFLEIGGKGIEYLPNDFAKILPNLTYLYCPRHLKELPVLPMSLVDISINKYIDNWNWLTPNIKYITINSSNPLHKEYYSKGIEQLKAEYCYLSVTKRALKRN